MSNPYVLDPNSFRRKFRILRYFNISLGKINKEIENSQHRKKIKKWTEEEKMENEWKIRQLIELERKYRNHLTWYKTQLLENCNITG